VALHHVEFINVSGLAGVTIEYHELLGAMVV